MRCCALSKMPVWSWGRAEISGLIYTDARVVSSPRVISKDLLKQMGTKSDDTHAALFPVGLVWGSVSSSNSTS